MRRYLPLLCVFVLGSFAAMNACSSEITVEKSEGGATVKIDGRPFTEYLTQSGTKPILWPIYGPTDQPMTRDYPMRDGTDEVKDHIHQRSFWFTHGRVNGVNFWCEPESLPAGDKNGTIKHLKFVKLESGKPAEIVTENAWLDPDGKEICEDQRTLRFDSDGDARWIDFDVTIKANHGPVTFADDKEGSFGLRVAESLTVDAKQGGKIVNAEGKTNGDAWGKRSPWVDYNGPVDGEKVGVAIFNHPESFGFPGYWHVRTYGLFAANPFGVQAFTGDKQQDGSYTIPAGDSMTLRYRVYLHRGDEKDGKVAEAYRVYAGVGK